MLNLNKIASQLMEIKNFKKLTRTWFVLDWWTVLKTRTWRCERISVRTETKIL